MLEHLTLFACVAYAHIPDLLCKKLDDKWQIYIFVNYSQVRKGYKLYNLVTRKLIISRDAIFDEEASWDLSQEEKKILES